MSALLQGIAVEKRIEYLNEWLRDPKTCTPNIRELIKPLLGECYAYRKYLFDVPRVARVKDQ